MVRICGDFKVTLNPVIEIDKYPLPRIEELFVKLQGGVSFTKLDLANAYQQVFLDENSKEMVCISTHKGLFRYNRVHFGIAGVPAKFQKLMDTLLEGIEGTLVFLDDILITGKNRKEHWERLNAVLNRFKEAGLKISFDICNFFQSQISYLGYIINREGLHTDPKKLKFLEKCLNQQI